MIEKFREMYRKMTDEVWRDYYEAAAWGIETGVPLWERVCNQDDSIKEGQVEAKELQFRYELEKLKVLLGMLKQEHLGAAR